MKMLDRIRQKNDVYDDIADQNDRPENKVKVTAKAKGQLSDGFTQLKMPTDKTKSLISDGPVKNFGPAWKPKGRK